MRHVKFRHLDELEHRIKHALKLERDEAPPVAELLKTAFLALLFQLLGEHLNLTGRYLILVDSEALPVKNQVIAFILLAVTRQLTLPVRCEIIAILGGVDRLSDVDFVVEDFESPRDKLKLARKRLILICRDLQPQLVLDHVLSDLREDFLGRSNRVNG